MDIRRSTAMLLWSFVLIILICNFNVDAAKTSRRGGSSSKKTPNYDHVALSYGHRASSSNHQPVQQHQVQQTHTQQAAHAPSAPSAPALPSSNSNNNKPVGWNVPHTDTVAQPKTVPQTHSAPYPQNPPPYQQNAGFNTQHSAGPPPPYSANPNPAFNSHPPAGPPPPYSQNPNPSFTSSHGQQPPAYQPNQPAASYPVHSAPNAAYPQQNYNMNPAGIHPNGGQAPIINNYYGTPGIQSGISGGGGGGGSGPSLLGTALAAGAGSIAGNALYGALKPDSDHKTVIIHENAPVAQAPVAPVAQAPIPASPSSPIAAVEPMTSTVSVPLPSSEQPTVAQAPMSSVNPPPYSPSVPSVPYSSSVPLAPLPEQQSSMAPSSPPSMFPSPAMPESSTPIANPIPSTNVPIINTSAARVENPTPTVTTSSRVPLAPFPSDTSAQAQKGSATSFVIFNVSVYTIISILIAGLF